MEKRYQKNFSVTRRDLINVIAGALIAIVATGFYDCLFYFQKEEFENFNYAFTATIGTLGLFVIYSIFFFLIFPSTPKQSTCEDKEPKVNDSDTANTNKEREFQFEMSGLQREYDKSNSVLTVIGIALGLLGTIGAIMYTPIEPSLRTYLSYIAIIPIAVAVILTIALMYQYKRTIRNKSEIIKNKFIYVQSDDKQLEVMQRILLEQQKTNECLMSLEKELEEKKARKTSNK